MPKTWLDVIEKAFVALEHTGSCDNEIVEAHGLILRVGGDAKKAEQLPFTIIEKALLSLYRNDRRAYGPEVVRAHHLVIAALKRPEEARALLAEVS